MDRDLASAPDSAPTGKTQKLSKNECVLRPPARKSRNSCAKYPVCFQSSAARPQARAEKMCTCIAAASRIKRVDAKHADGNKDLDSVFGGGSHHRNVQIASVTANGAKTRDGEKGNIPRLG